ncbi:hypothetical protein GCM10009760_16530 [Kitasatospora kazusensis]|uniref:Uncharacterized protein n=1 Tax=Kitasatospora kazusensis TaxID=407974 RepID=A0ABN2Z4X9_9ACTN
MREFTNLSWPQTPYGVDKRPFGRPVRLLTGLSVQWADNGSQAVPVAAAAVFLPVHRTATVLVDLPTLHFGYRVLATEGDREAPELVAFLDGVLVQGRRDSAGLAWHSFADDVGALLTYAPGRMPGITAVADGWADRSARERGTAQLTDTADDSGLSGWSVNAVCRESDLDCPTGDNGILAPAEIQRLYDSPTAATAQTAEALGCSALHQALAVALLAGHTRCHIRWDGTLPLGRLARAVAWDSFPKALTATPLDAAGR